MLNVLFQNQRESTNNGTKLPQDEETHLSSESLGSSVPLTPQKQSLSPLSKHPWMVGRGLPFILAGLIFCVTVWMWQSLLAQDRDRIEQMISAELEKVEGTTSKAFDLHISALIRMAERWTMYQTPPLEEWKGDAKNYLRDFQGFVAIGALDSQKNMQWRVRAELDQRAQSVRFDPDEDIGSPTLLAAMNLSEFRTRDDVKIVRDGELFVVVVPVFQGQEVQGVILALFNLADWMAESVNDFPSSDYGLTVFYQNEALLSLGVPAEQLVPGRAVESDMVFRNITFNTKMCPSVGFLARQEPLLPNITFVIGSLMAMLSGLLVGTAQVARRRQLAVESMNQQLAQENSERKNVQQGLQESEERFRFAFEDGPLGLALTRDDFSFMKVNKAFCRMLEYSEPELSRLSFIDVTDPRDSARCVALGQKVMAGHLSDYSLDKRCLTKSGNMIWINLRGSLVTAPDDGKTCLLATIEDITAKKHIEDLQALQTAVLEKTVQHHPVKEVLELLCRQIEHIVSPSVCSVMVFDEGQQALVVAAAPSGSATVCTMLNGLVPGEQAGSCGTAFYTGQLVVVSDTATDPLWEPYRDVATTLGIKSCWSIPIFAQEKKAIGTFAISHPHSRQPTAFHLNILETASSLAGLALQHQRSAESLKSSEDRYRDLYHLAPLAYLTTDMEGHILSANARTSEILGCFPDAFIGHSVMEFYTRSLEGLEQDKGMRERNQPQREHVEILRPDGTCACISITSRVIVDTKGNPIERREIWQDVTSKRQTERLLSTQKEILESVARGHSLKSILSELCVLMEREIAGMLCSVHLLHEDILTIAASPSFPISYTQAIERLTIGDGVGSCGTAAFRNEAMMISDIEHHPFWKCFKELALSHGLKSCWSTPVRSSDGSVLGTFAMYFKETRAPLPEDWNMIELATNLAGIAIEHRRVQEGLEISEKRYRVLYDDNPTMYFTVSAEGMTLSVNKFGASQLGYTVSELVGQPVLNVFHPDDQPQAQESMKNIFMNPREVAHWEFRKQRKNGTQIWVKETAKVVSQSGSSPVVLIVCEDISKEKEAQWALQERIELEALDADISRIVMNQNHLPEMLQRCTERLVTRLDVVVAAIWMVDSIDQTLKLQGCMGLDLPRQWYQEPNDMRETLIGYIAEQQIPHLTNTLIGDTNILEQEWVMKEELRAFAGYPLIVNNVLLGVMALFSRHTWTEATPHTLEMVASHIALGIEKNLSEHARKKGEGQLQAILDNSSAVIYMKDLEGRFMLINRTFENLFHVDRRTVQGKTDYDIFPPDIAKVMRANDQIALASYTPVESEEVAPHSDGPHIYLSSKFHLVNAEGIPYATGGISTDITNRKRAEEALQVSEQQLRASIDERTRISQDLHDHILQSLYATGLIIAAAKQPILAQASEEALGYLEQAIAQLNVGIEEIRLFIEGIPQASVDIGDFTTELAALVHAMNLPLSTEFNMNLEPHAIQCLNQEQTLHLLNIARESMSNCVRHAQATRGTISLVKNNGMIEFIIEDNGIGFESRDAQREGHGLKNMHARASQMQGTFHISSLKGEGTKISIQLSHKDNSHL